MPNQISNRLLSKELHELIINEIDIEGSEVNKLIEQLSLNIILKGLTQKKRIQFYRLVGEEKLNEAELFIQKEIPDFKKRLLVELKNRFGVVL